MGDRTYDARAKAQSHLVPHFTKGAQWCSETHGVIERGEGCYVWDTDGNKYLDGLAGLFCTNLGHGRHDLTAAAAKQMDQLAYFPNWGWSNPATAEAAAMIAERAPGDLNHVFFVSSGSEAVESAIKFARNYHYARGETDRYKVIARDWAYHGTTIGTLAITGIPKFKTHFEPMMWEGVRHVPNTCGATIPDSGTAADLWCVRAVEEMILAEGPETVSMVIAEPVQNGRGAVVPPDGYWQELRAICDRHGVLLCADEIINAFGRLGHWTGSERMGVVPDLITFAKGVTSAYMPLGGIMVRDPLVEELWDSELGMYNHGSTFGGHPVACAVAVANIRAMHDEKINEHVLAHEGHFRSGLESVMAAHDCVGDVRGTGYFYAVEFCASRAEGRELSDEQHAGLRGGVLAEFIRDAKIMIRPDDRGATFLAISPPLVADTTVIDDLVARVDQIAARTSDWLAAHT